MLGAGREPAGLKLRRVGALDWEEHDVDPAITGESSEERPPMQHAGGPSRTERVSPSQQSMSGRIRPRDTGRSKASGVVPRGGVTNCSAFVPVLENAQRERAPPIPGLPQMTSYPKASTDPHGTTPSSPRFPEIEERVLSYWKNDSTFQASIDARDAGVDGANEFVFYDGPPFANGLPHYGHLLTGYVKDLVARYQTQRGSRVERRFGWDTHGLPAELEAMKQLGMTDKAADRVHGHRQVQRRLPHLGHEVRRRVAELRHPPGTLGRLRERLQDAERRVHGIGHLGVQAAARQGPDLPGLPRAAVLLEGRDPAVQPRAAHGRRRVQGPPGPDRHRLLPAAGRRVGDLQGARGRAGAGLDHHPVDPADQHGPGRRPRGSSTRCCPPARTA